MKKRLIWVPVAVLVAALAGCKKEEAKTPPENYTVKIPGTDVKIDMVYVPGGEFEMGSPDNEPGRLEDEGPRRKVRLKPYWIGKTEVTWQQFEAYAFLKDPTMIDAITMPSPKITLTFARWFSRWARQRVELALGDSLDAITRPSPYYGDYYQGMGRGRKPVIGISWLTVNTFCEWLSKKTRQTYRLPTEAEWEYACRAGSETAYSFGSDESELGDYAWYESNSDFETQEVARKAPNAFGLYDMHGNVWEFTLDNYAPGFYKELENPGVNVEPRGPKKGKPVLRGGSWDDTPDKLRSARRLEQLDWWNERDPQRPRGRWWLIDGNVVGFRVARAAEE